MNLSTVFAKMAMLILIMLLGYLCARIGITGPEFNKRVTPLMVTVLMPARDYDPAAAEEDSILLQGVVDCWFETPEGITVVDFKTDFVQTEEDVAQHAELYRGQLAAYSLALERVLEKAVTRKALYFLQAGKTVEIS